MMSQNERVENFWNRVKKTTECWIWTGFTNDCGYGKLSWGSGKVVKTAHRLSWELTHGRIPSGKHVLHNCDNPACVRPSHLYVGTHSENMRDLAFRQRGGLLKITNSDVVVIRLARANGVSRLVLAKRYGVHPEHITAIVSGHRRKWIPIIKDKQDAKAA